MTGKILRTAIFLCISATIANAQLRFQKTIGGMVLDWANSIQQTPADSGYIILGSTKNFGAGAQDIYLIKTNVFGDTLWTRTFGGLSGDEEGTTVQLTSDGGYIISGTTETFGAGSGDIYLVKTNSTGDLVWSKTYGGTNIEYCTGMQQCTDGGYILSGYTSSFGAGGSDAYIIRTNSVGDTLWTKTIGTPGQDKAFAVRQTSDSGFVVAGSATVNGSIDAFLLKTDASGAQSWLKTYGSDSTEIAYSVIQTTDGGYCFAGSTSGSGAGQLDIYLIKTDAAGDTTWTKTIGDANNEVCFSLHQNTDGGYILTGYSNSFGVGGGDDLLAIRTDVNGQALWTRTVGGISNAREEGRSVIQTIDGGFMISGFTQSFGLGGTDIFLVKADSTGLSGCNHINLPVITGITASTIGNGTSIITMHAGIVGNPFTLQGFGAGDVHVACTSAGIDEVQHNLNVQVYPNPMNTSALVVINGNTLGGDISFILSDMQGRIVMKQIQRPLYSDGETVIPVNRETLSPGMYFYSVTASYSFTVSGKLVVE